MVTGKGYVSSATRERVVEAMARTGYVVNREARALAGGRHQVIGLLVPDLDTSYVGEILRGIDEELAAASYDLMLYTTHRRKTRESEFVRSLSQGSTDGLLMILPMDPEAYAESIQRRDFPYVIVDHTGVDEQGPAVGTTNRLGAIDATRYLLSLGHRRIGFITGIPEMGCAQERLVGYQEALLAGGLPYDAALVQEGNFRQPLAYECTRRLLALPEPPSAIFAANDISAYGVMDAVRDAGLRIPDHVSVIGFDDIPSSSAQQSAPDHDSPANEGDGSPRDPHALRVDRESETRRGAHRSADRVSHSLDLPPNGGAVAPDERCAAALRAGMGPPVRRRKRDRRWEPAPTAEPGCSEAVATVRRVREVSIPRRRQA